MKYRWAKYLGDFFFYYYYSSLAEDNKNDLESIQKWESISSETPCFIKKVKDSGDVSIDLRK